MKTKLLALLLAGLLCLGAAACAPSHGRSPAPPPGRETGVPESGTAESGPPIPAAPETSGSEAGAPETAASGTSDLSPEGWTFTVDEAVGDSSFASLTLTVTAPEGTVLDADNYLLDCVPLVGPSGCGWSVDRLEDDAPFDNQITFRVELTGNFSGDEGALNISKLEGVYWTEGHVGESWFTVVTGDWTVPFRIEPAGDALTYQIHQTVETEKGPVTVGSVEVTPLSITIELSGDAVIKTGRVEVVYPNGRPHPNTIPLELLDKNGRPLEPSMSGGPVEDGIWKMTVSFASPIDPGEAAAIVLDGKNIPLA